MKTIKTILSSPHFSQDFVMMDSAFVNAIPITLGNPPQILVPENPIYTGALGASLLALKFADNRLARKPMSARCDIE
jgi:hypothetical protein